MMRSFVILVGLVIFGLCCLAAVRWWRATSRAKRQVAAWQSITTILDELPDDPAVLMWHLWDDYLPKLQERIKSAPGRARLHPSDAVVILRDAFAVVARDYLIGQLNDDTWQLVLPRQIDRQYQIALARKPKVFRISLEVES